MFNAFVATTLKYDLILEIWCLFESALQEEPFDFVGFASSPRGSPLFLIQAAK